MPRQSPVESTFSRRHFLTAAAAHAVGFAALHRHVGMAAASITLGAFEGLPGGDPGVGYGPLRPDPHRILDLPEGFTYRVISRLGDEMDDGLLLPGSPDGMAAFPVDGDPAGRYSVLVRNHELEPTSLRLSPFGENAQRLIELGERRKLLYDAGYGFTPGLGGTTTLLYDHDANRVVKQYLSLGGTVRNCAGGPTPWGTWITCEETAAKVGAKYEKDHGYNFEVPGVADGRLVEPVPLKAMGRFQHEAVAVDPLSGIVYQTEDRHEGLIYRFLPDNPGRNGDPGKLHKGGRLQILAVKGRPSLDTRNWPAEAHSSFEGVAGNGTGVEGIGQEVKVGQTFEVEWLDVEDPENPEDKLRFEGFDRGAARFARGEGMWYGNNCVYFACTNGGLRQKGQIWKYVPSRFEGQPEEKKHPGRLELFIEPNDGNLVDNADNLTVAPWGDLIVAEDGGAAQYLRGVTRDGRLYTLAQNSTGNSEFAGVCFSPAGKTLFVNIQKEGLTLAVEGPWDRQR